MARPNDPFPAASEVAEDKFLAAADPAPDAPPTDPGVVPEGAPPVLALGDFLPTISPAAQEIGIVDDQEFPGPDFLSDLFGL